MARDAKDRLVSVLEMFERRLTVIDDCQAEMLGGLENMRATLHDVNNSMTVIKNMMPDIEKSLETDGLEIKAILRTLDSVVSKIETLSTKVVGREDIMRSLIREKGSNNG